MNETLILPLVLAATAGCALGALFFGGLWWTVRKAVSSQRPSFWLLGSLLLRTGITLAGFYYVGSGHWQRLLACCLGFVLARFIVIRLTAAPVTAQNISGKEVDHASQS
ncbi:MAG: ATP synthase subunit I [Desulfobulbus sp.]